MYSARGKWIFNLLLVLVVVMLPMHAFAAGGATGPIIANVSPTNQATVYTSMPTITANLRDTGSGIDGATIQVKVNGVPAPFQVDSSTGILAAATQGLPNGTYQLTVDVSDEDGNPAEQWKSTFNVLVDAGAGKIEYLALGDSLAAGMTPYKSIGLSYTDTLAEYIHSFGYLGEFNKNHTYPGYTTQDVLNDIKNNVAAPNGKTIKQNIASADVITLDIGVNDLLSQLSPTYTIDPAIVPGLIEQAGMNTGLIVAAIKQLNPTVNVYLMGYYDAFHNFPFPILQKQEFAVVLNYLNQTLAGVAAQTGAIFVSTGEAIAADYANHLPNSMDIHPSELGYKAIADAFWNVMKNSYVWPLDSTLTAASIDSSSLTLNWTPANGGADYKIFNGEAEAATVSGSVYKVTGLSADTFYTFKVEAKLPNGIWTTNGPTITAKTTAVGSSSGNTNTNTVPKANELTAKEINDLIASAGTSAVIAIDVTGTEPLLLPSNVGELLQQANKALLLKASGQSITIPFSVLNELNQLGSGDEWENAKLQITFKEVQDSTDDDLVKAANLASGASIKQNGQLYELDFTLVSTTGKTIRLDRFNEPITLRYTLVSDNTDTNLLGIYYLNESLKQWEYVGGEIGNSKTSIETALTHNSKYAVLEYTKTYADVPATHWAYQTIQRLSAIHVIEGVNSEQFIPTQTTTRAQFVTMLVRALGIQSTEAKVSFTDVAEGAWYAEAIAAAVQSGIIKGLDENHFAPNATITREQMAILLVRAYEYKTGNLLDTSDLLLQYTDAAQVTSWAQAEVNKALGAGLMQGPDKNTFAPNGLTVRAEAAQAIYNLLGK
ncbi:S-layer homology domain-containing protein [Paenibacillus sp. FSL H8-0548]|uniref:S-layer homology domain-containing protein n=1 Tax=Paenibacillus sp. FSL H8-0548 TaxID=1920422 RepID=UPI002115DF5A|nr:S-layer homology domain-containing protein [Paenibacillus sp. FSL H8-0548]